MVLIPSGARIDAGPLPPHGRSLPTWRKAFTCAIQQLSAPGSTRKLRVFTRPQGTPLAMDLDAMGKALVNGDAAVNVIAASWATGPLDIACMFERMMLVLWDTLMLAASERWTQRGVANLNHERTYLLAKSFLRGQAVGRRALEDGMCAYCGALLRGVQNDNSALSNKCHGPPIDIRGSLQKTADGTEAIDAQPPFLMNFSPALLAREVPAVFAHDPETNCLSLKDGVVRRWVRPAHRRQVAGKNSFLYCCECRDTHFPKPRSR